MKLCLIVEDLPDQAFVLSKLLKRLEVNTIMCHDAHSAIKRWERGDIDLIMTDIGLPEVNGIDMIRHIRKTDKRTPIAVITAYVQDYDRQTAFQAGANYYITKPILPGDLKRVINLI